MNGSNILHEILTSFLNPLYHCLQIFDIPMPSKDLLGIFFVMIFFLHSGDSNVQQLSYKHVTVCIFHYKYIFWSINNQNRPHAGGYSIQFRTLLIFLDLHNETVKLKCKAMAI